MSEFEKQTVRLNGVSSPALIPCKPGKFSKTPDGTHFEVKEKKIRALGSHTFSFKLAEICQEHLPNNAPLKWAKPIDIIYSLSIAIGFVRVIPGIEGGEHVIARSISFDSMDQKEHDRVIDALMRKCAELCKVDYQWIKNQHLEFISFYGKKNK